MPGSFVNFIVRVVPGESSTSRTRRFALQVFDDSVGFLFFFFESAEEHP